MLIVGSKALIHSLKIKNRIPNDTDIICSKEDFLKLKSELKPKKVIIKEEVIGLIDVTFSSKFPEITTKNVELLLHDNSVSLKKYLEYDNAFGDIKYASAEVLFSLKKSHINFPIKFNKHIIDYSILHKHFNGEDKLEEVTKINFKETENRIGKLKTPSLNKPVKKFFKQSEKFFKSYFIHDDLHKVMSHYGYPLYEKMQYDLTLAKCEKELWNKFTFEEKCKCVLEEVYVIALERKIIPMLFGNGKYYSSEEAMKWALMRVCTTLCGGWFRQFATDNYYSIFDFYNKDYVDIFLKNYDEGKIKMIINE